MSQFSFSFLLCHSGKTVPVLSVFPHMALKLHTYTLLIQVLTCTSPVCVCAWLGEHERICKVCLSIYKAHLFLRSPPHSYCILSSFILLCPASHSAVTCCIHSLYKKKPVHLPYSSCGWYWLTVIWFLWGSLHWVSFWLVYTNVILIVVSFWWQNRTVV